MMKIPADIPGLIEKFQSGTATPEEISRLNEWYHSFDDSEVEIADEEELMSSTNNTVLLSAGRKSEER